MAIQKACILPEEEKLKLYETAQYHIDRACKERDNSQVSAAQSAWSTSEHGNSPPTLGHYSYDFAQQVHFPFNAQQVGSEFCKTARKYLGL